MRKITIHLLSIKVVEGNKSLIVPFLPHERIEKATKLAQKNDQLLSLAVGYLLYKFNENQEIKYTSEGKPYIEGKQISISHSGEYAIYAEDIYPIGIDIQNIKPINVDFINYTSSKKERNLIKNEEDFFLHWTKKESILKCLGTGINTHLDNVPYQDGLVSYRLKKFYVQSTIFQEYAIAVTSLSKKPFEIEIVEDVF